MKFLSVLAVGALLSSLCHATVTDIQCKSFATQTITPVVHISLNADGSYSGQYLPDSPLSLECQPGPLLLNSSDFDSITCTAPGQSGYVTVNSGDGVLNMGQSTLERLNLNLYCVATRI